MLQGKRQRHEELQFLMKVEFAAEEGYRTLLTSMMKQFLYLTAGFEFTSREHISQHLPMTVSET